MVKNVQSNLQLTHSDGTPAPRRVTRTMSHPSRKSHSGGGRVASSRNAASPPQVAAKRLGTKLALFFSRMSMTPRWALAAASDSILSQPLTFSTKYRPARQP